MRVLICFILLAAMPAVDAAERGSPALVRQLVSAMGARNLDAIAVADRTEPGRYLAALVFPDVQMLVVSSRHESTAQINALIAAGKYRDVYIMLQGGVPEGRLFFHDMGCDGVQEEPTDSDIYYEGASGRTILDGNWAAQSITAAEYTKKIEEADERYTRALAVLLDAVRRIPTDR